MAHLTLLIVFLLLAGLDAVAALVAIERISSAGLPSVPAAIGLHLGLTLLATLAVCLVPRSGERSGRFTLSLLSATFCFLTPVLGFLVGAWLVGLSPRLRRDSELWDHIHLGNPLSAAARLDRPSPAPISQPLITALRHGHRPAQRHAAPLLRHLIDRRALSVLRHLREQPDARTQLYAQSALSTLAENREHQIESLHREVARNPDSLADHERLATALLETADALLRGPAESHAMIEEAHQHFEKAIAIDPADAACLFGKAQCQLRLGDLGEMPDLYGRICALPGASSYADRLELAYFGALGNWQRITETAERFARERRGAGLDAGQRHFWLTRSAASPSATSAATAYS